MSMADFQKVEEILRFQERQYAPGVNVVDVIVRDLEAVATDLSEASANLPNTYIGNLRAETEHGLSVSLHQAAELLNEQAP
jgi:hypothetical protein